MDGQVILSGMGCSVYTSKCGSTQNEYVVRLVIELTKDTRYQWLGYYLHLRFPKYGYHTS